METNEKEKQQLIFQKYEYEFILTKLEEVVNSFKEGEHVSALLDLGYLFGDIQDRLHGIQNKINIINHY